MGGEFFDKRCLRRRIRIHLIYKLFIANSKKGMSLDHLLCNPISFHPIAVEREAFFRDGKGGCPFGKGCAEEKKVDEAKEGDEEGKGAFEDGFVVVDPKCESEKSESEE